MSRESLTDLLFLAALVAFLLPGVARAQVVQTPVPQVPLVNTPSGWVYGPSPSPGWVWNASTSRGSVAFNVAGQAVRVPATTQVAVARAAAAIVPFLRVNPAVAVGAAALSTWLADSNIAPLPDGSGYVVTAPPSTVYAGYANTNLNSQCGTPPSTAHAACALDSVCFNCAGLISGSRIQDGQLVVELNGGYVYGFPLVGPTQVPGGTRPATEADWQALQQSISAIPDAVLNALRPHLAVPVQAPTVVPSTVAIGSPQPQPDGSLRVPTATIAPVPGSTTAQGTITTGTADPATITPPEADGAPGAGAVTVNVEVPDFCAQFPDRAGCVPIGSAPQAEDIGQRTVNVAITPVPMGAANAACPAPRRITLVSGFAFDVPNTLMCTAMEMARPFIIAGAWLSAVLILVGVRNTGDES